MLFNGVYLILYLHKFGRFPVVLNLSTKELRFLYYSLFLDNL